MLDILEISSEEFDEQVLHSKDAVVVEFFSHSCPHCQKFSPLYDQLAEKMNGKAKFFKIDVLLSEENRNLAHSRGVHTVPTIEVFNKGRVIGSMVGYHEIGKLISALKEFLARKDDNIGQGTPINNLIDIHKTQQ